MVVVAVEVVEFTSGIVVAPFKDSALVVYFHFALPARHSFRSSCSNSSNSYSRMSRGYNSNIRSIYVVVVHVVVVGYIVVA